MAMTVGELVAYLRLDERDFGNGIDQVGKDLNRLDSRASSSMASVEGSVSSALATIEKDIESGLDPKRAIQQLDRLESSMDQGLDKMVHAARDFGSKLDHVIDDAFNDLPKKAKKTGDEAAQGFGDGLGSGGKSKLPDIGNSFLGSLKGLGWAAAGAAIGSVLMKGLESAMDAQDAKAKLFAQLGTTPEQSKVIGAAAGKAFVSGYGENLGEVTDALKSVVQNLDGMRGASEDTLTSMAKRAMDVSTIMDEDVGGVTRAVSQMLRTGLAPSAESAFDTLVRGTQLGANVAEDLLDTFSEYGTQFRDLGLSADDALGIMVQGLKAGARDSDTVADALKEMNIRVQDLSAAPALKKLGLNAQDMAKAFGEGGAKAKGALDTILDRLRAVKDPTERYALAQQILGTKSEDLAKALMGIDPSSAVAGLGKVDGAAKTAGDTLHDTASNKLESFKRALQQGLVDFLGGTVIPKLEEFGKIVGTTFDWIKKLVGKFADGDWSGAWDMIVQLASDAWELIKKGAAIAWDWIKAKAGEALDGLVAWLKTLPGKALDGLKALGDVILTWISDQISGVGEKAPDIGKALVDWILDLPSKITDGLTTASKAITDWIGDAIEWVGEKSGDLRDAFLAWLSELPGKIQEKAVAVGETIAEWIKGLPEKIKSKATEIGEAAADWLKELPNKIGPWLDKAKDAIVDWAKSLPDKIKSAIGTGEELMQKLQEWGPKIAMGLVIAFGVAVLAIPAAVVALVAAVAVVIGTVVSELAQALWDKLSDAMRQAGNAISAGVDDVVKWFRGLPGKAVEAVSSLGSKLRSWASDLLSSLVAKFGEVRDGVVAKFGELKDKAVAKAGELVSWMKSLPDKIKSGLGHLGSLLLQAGKDLIQGLVNGIKNMAGRAIDAAKSVVGDAVQGAKNLLGIKSPSKVFTEIGKFTVMGFVEGILAEQPRARMTAKKFADLMKEALSVKLDKNAPDSLVEWVKKNTGELKDLADKREAIIKRIADAKAYASQIASSAADFASLTAIDLGDDAGVDTLVTGLANKLHAVKEFEKDIKKLAKLGLNKTTLRQIIDAGPDKGLSIAEMLLSGDKADIKAINRIQKQLEKTTKQLGKTAADSLYDQGKQAGKGFLKGLEGQLKEIEGMMAKIAKAVVDAVKKELKVKSPSRVFMDIGDNTMLGWIKGLADRRDETVATMTDIAGAVISAGSTGGSIEVPGLAAVTPKPMSGPSSAPAWGGGYGNSGQTPGSGTSINIDMSNSVIREQADIGRIGAEFAFGYRARG